MKLNEIEAELHSLTIGELVILKSFINKRIDDKKEIILPKTKIALSDGHISEIARLKAKYRAFQYPKLN